MPEKHTEKGITPPQMLEKLAERHLKIARRVILNYEEWGLIPKPIERTGKKTLYPQSAVYEFLASFRVMHGYMRTPKEVAGIRSLALFLDECDNTKQEYEDDIKALVKESENLLDSPGTRYMEIVLEVRAKRKVLEEIEQTIDDLSARVDFDTFHLVDVWRRERDYEGQGVLEKLFARWYRAKTQKNQNSDKEISQ